MRAFITILRKQELRQVAAFRVSTAPSSTAIVGRMVLQPIFASAWTNDANWASSSYVPTIAPPEPANFAEQPTERAVMTMR